MKTIHIPYNREYLPLNVKERNLKALLFSKIHEYDPGKSEEAIVKESLVSPIGSEPLARIARGKKKVTIVTSDHTRAMPSRITMPFLLEEIRKGSPQAEIIILIGTGLHRASTEDELRVMLGDLIVKNENIVIHDAFDKENLCRVCTLPSGAAFIVNRLAIDCDLLITEGFIEPHFFAGFSGGRKSILPGICSLETVNENHSYNAVANPKSAAGITTGNPIHEDMVFAARKVNVQFILNVALDGKKRIIAAFSGDLTEAHERGCEFLKEHSLAAAVEGDIVITSNGGYPLDQNLYQTPKSVVTAEACAAEGAVIILCASCIDGFGGKHFEELMLSGSVEQLDKMLSIVPPKETIPEMWCAQTFARILKKHKIILVTDGIDPELVYRANMIPVASPDEALEYAFKLKGDDARVIVIPDGVSVLIEKNI